MPNVPQTNVGHIPAPGMAPGGASGDPNDVGPGEQLPPLVTQARLVGSVVKPTDPSLPKAKRYRAEGIPREGVVFLEKGRHVRIPPGKVFDERYHDIPFIMQQGIELVEIDEKGRKIVPEAVAS